MGDEREKDNKEYKDGNENSKTDQGELAEVSESGLGTRVFVSDVIRPSDIGVAPNLDKASVSQDLTQ